MAKTDTGNRVKYRRDYRKPTHKIPEVHLHFSLHPEHTKVVCRMRIVPEEHAQTTCLSLDGEQLELLALLVDGAEYDYQLTDSGLSLDIADACWLEIHTQINPSNNFSLEGLYYVDGTFCTQCEAEGFRKITYFLDRPDVLSVYRVEIEADASSFPDLLSNGNLIGFEQVGSVNRATWHDPHPKPCYLFALVAGMFDRLESQFLTSSGRMVTTQMFVTQGQAEQGRFALEALHKAMKWDEEVYGFEYDLDIYQIVAVDFFNMGAMENKGLNVFNSKFVLADPAIATDMDYYHIESVIAHEYFHNWTGNRITCRDWFQLSLKEGLTVFRDQSFSEQVYSRLFSRLMSVNVIRSAQFAEDASPMAHPIRPDQVQEMNNFYTVTVYDKGAEVIRMLKRLIGDTAYYNGIRQYVSQHDGTAATCDDFLDAMQTATGLDLREFRGWYSQSGTPRIDVTLAASDELPFATIRLKSTHELELPLALEVFLLQANERVHGQQIEWRFSSNTGALSLSEYFSQEQLAATTAAVVLGPADFSAPIECVSPYTVDQLLAVADKVQDPILKLDCYARLVADDIQHEGVKSIDFLQRVLPELLGELVLNGSSEHQLTEVAELAASLLELPSFDRLLMMLKPISPSYLIQQRERLLQCAASRLKEALFSVYHGLKQYPYRFAPADVNARTIRNRSLSLLSYSADPGVHSAVESLAVDQYATADNMTDRLAALTTSLRLASSAAQTLLSDFEHRFGGINLAMDKWLACQSEHLAAEATSFERIRALQASRYFNLKNPNRVRALMGTFAFKNHGLLHLPDGSGYRFLVDHILELDAINPQTASRLITPLLSYDCYDIDTRTRILVTLRQLANESRLSKDVSEKVSSVFS